MHTPRAIRRSLIAAAVACCFGPSVVHANPVGPTVTHGQASFAQKGKLLTVTNSPGSIIHWRGFSIAADETTRFAQQSAASAVLNRVTGADPSSILGALQSNGRVFLVNPNGIIFGAGARIDTAGLVASTLNIMDADFLTGRMRFGDTPGAQSVSNAGEIRTPAGGRVLLISPQDVENSGIIHSPQGEVILAAGKSVEIADSANPEVRVEIAAPESRAVNLGKIVAESGKVGIYGGIVANRGLVSADSAVVGENGKIVFRASQSVSLDPGSQVSASGPSGGTIAISTDSKSPDAQGVVYQRGEVRADGNADGIGGTVTVRTDNVLSTASISADGGQGGGHIAIVAAERVLASASSQLSANGVTGGGGEIDVRAGHGLYTSGGIDATGSVGGVVRLLGEDVKLATATVSVDGELSGGTIKVGGGFQGQEPLPNANTTVVGTGSVLSANAKRSGNGGRVVVWADGETRFSGEIKAQGGAQSGNGGFVEVSGKESLGYAGEVKVDAPMGTPGTLLLDPKNIIIVPDAGSGLGIELLDPNPTAGANFGDSTTTLNNGNFLVRDANDSFGATATGAVYLFDGTTGALLGTVQGTSANEQLGLTVDTFRFSNDNYLIRSPDASAGDGTLTTAGAVIMASGTSGNELGRVSGTSIGERFGANSPNFLGNQNYVIRSPNRTVGGNANAGAVVLASGMDGTELGKVEGNAANEQLGNLGVDTFHFGNDNYLIRSPDANGAGGVATVGAVIMASGTTGLETGRVEGASAAERLGAFFPSFLGNGNYAIRSPNRTVAGNANAGAVVLASGTDGTELGKVEGNAANEQLGNFGVDTFRFSNDNYVIRSPDANGAGGVATGGAVILASGTTGAEIGRVAGISVGERLGADFLYFLGNENYVIRSRKRTVGGNANAGAVVLASGTTGTELGKVEGNAANEQLGSQNLDFSQVNSNYIIRSPDANGAGGVATGGAVIMASDTTGLETGRVEGASAAERLGANFLSFLGNGNYVIRSPNRTVGGNANAGAVVLADGVDGAELGKVEGTAANEQLGNFGVDTFRFSNDNYLIRSPDANGTGGVASGGAVILASGTSGNELGHVSGASIGERLGANAPNFLGNENYVIRSPNRTVGGNANAGAVVLASATTGNELGKIEGNAANERLGNFGVDTFRFSNDNYLIRSPDASAGDGMLTTAGAVIMASGTSGNELGRVSGASSGERLGANSLNFLGNENYVVRSPNRTVGGNANAGAVVLASATTGNELGKIEGNAANEQLGNQSLAFSQVNSNYIIRSPDANGAGGVATGGAVIMASDTTGLETGRVEGASAAERLGAFFPSFLGNGNYAIRSPNRTVGGNANAGAVVLADGATGAELGKIEGNAANEQLGNFGVDTFRFSNDNYLIRSPDANGAGGVATGGAVIMASGTSGNELGRVSGASSGERLGANSPNFLGNENYVIRSPNRTVGGNANAGAVVLADGADGTELGKIEGNAPNELLGNLGITQIANFNYRVLSPDAAGVGGVAQGGAVIVGSGVTGAELGRVSGSSASERLGSLGVTTNFQLGNNYLIRSPLADVAGVVDAGTVVLASGATGAEIGRTSGSSANEVFGNSFPTFFSNTYVVPSPLTDVGGSADAGAVVLVDAATGTEISRVSGNAANEQMGSLGINFTNNPDTYLIRSPNATANGQLKAGAVITVHRATGAEIGRATGIVADDQFGNQFPDFFSTGDFLIRNPDANLGALSKAGAVVLVSGTTGQEIARLTGNSANELLGNNVSFVSGDRRLVRSGDGAAGGLATAGRLFLVGPGLVFDGSDVAQNLLFGTDPSGTSIITATAISNALLAGTELILQANNDITLSAGAEIVSTNELSSLKMQAGRNIVLNSNITTSGQLTLVANETQDGIVVSNKEPGAGTIEFGPGVTITAGIPSSSIANTGTVSTTLPEPTTFSPGEEPLETVDVTLTQDGGRLEAGFEPPVTEPEPPVTEPEPPVTEPEPPVTEPEPPVTEPEPPVTEDPIVIKMVTDAQASPVVSGTQKAQDIQETADETADARKEEGDKAEEERQEKEGTKSCS